MIDANEAELHLLGSLLHNPQAIIEIDIKPGDFAEPYNGVVFCRFQELYQADGTFSIASFNGTAKQMDYLRSLLDWCVVAQTETILSYARVVKEAAAKRRILATCDVIKAQPEMSAAEMLAMMADAIEGETDAAAIRSGEEVYREILKSLDGPAAVYPTGLHRLDTGMGGGLYPGFTYGLCGAEKAGKTTLAHTISYNLDKQGIPHLYVALEMGSAQIEQRNLARDAGINSLRFLEDRAGAARSIVGLRPRQHVRYLDAPGSTAAEILNGVSSALAKHQIKGFIVDYWQLVQGQQPRETEEKHLRHVAQSFANFGRRHGLWCILLAQMNADGKLFGGNGLRKACDQLYMIEQIEGHQHDRWLRMDASRYTLRLDIGSDTSPALVMNVREGPHFYAID